MASTTEQSFNFALGDILRKKHPLWKNAISAEQTKVLKDSPGKQPDIVMSLTGGSPVVIETEFMPATTVENDAISRLGEHLASTNKAIENVIAIRIPSKLREVEQDGIANSIQQTVFEYCLFSETKDECSQRWPEKGWLQGGIDDVANCLESATLSESLISKSTDILEDGVAQSSNILGGGGVE